MYSPCRRLLTDRAVAWCGFGTGAKIADIGCGDGETTQYLKTHYGFDARGLDKHADGDLVILGDSHGLPFGDEELDGVFFLCSFSVMADPDRVLREAQRALKPDGFLILGDFYARAEEKNFLDNSPVLGRVERLETLAKRLRDGGLVLSLFEDHTRTMRHEWAQSLLEDGDSALGAEIARHREALREADCGYGLFIAKKERKQR